MLDLLFSFKGRVNRTGFWIRKIYLHLAAACGGSRRQRPSSSDEAGSKGVPVSWGRWPRAS